MLLEDRLPQQGHFIFRHRGVLPLLLLPIGAFAVWQSGGLVTHWFGDLFEGFWEGASILLATTGALVRIATVGFVPAGTSGRNTSEQRATVLNTTGLYSVVRNPLYLGNFLVMAGFAFGTEVPWFAGLSILAFALYYERVIAAEEGFLLEKFGEPYAAWARVTPAFIPNLRRWNAPALGFSWRAALRREYNGLYLVIVAFTILEVGHDLVSGEATLTQWPSDWRYYFAVTIVATLLYLPVRWAKRNTAWLRDPGRS